MIEDEFDYEIRYMAPPISEVVKIFKTTANSEKQALKKLTIKLGFEPDEIIRVDEY
jgi:hypothetical protein